MPSGIYKRKPFTEKHKKNMSLNSKGMLGKHHSDKTRKKLSLVNKGKHHSKETRQKMRLHAKNGEENNMWKGDNVGYSPLHRWIRRHKPKPEFCEICDEEKPYDMANITGIYNREFSNWKWACRKCHSKIDFPDGLRGKNLK